MKTYYVAGIPYSDELYHHGIKGQQWGVRRFQNEDGSLTAEGKERYGTVDNMRNQIRKEQLASESRKSGFKTTMSVMNPMNLFSKKARERAAENIKNNAKIKKKLEAAKEKADATEKSWMQDKYKTEIKRGAQLAKMGYDPDADFEAIERWGESLDRQLESHPYSERKGQDWFTEWQDKADIDSYQAARAAQEQRNSDYYLYMKWGIKK